MALQTQLLEIPMTGSLAEEVDPRVLAPGSWLRLENVTIDKLGSWRKRNGNDFLGYPETQSNSAPIFPRQDAFRFPFVGGVRQAVAYGVSTVGPTLYASWFDERLSAMPPWIGTWVPQDGGGTYGWEAKDTLPPFVLARSTEVRSARELECGACVQIEGVIWTAFKVASSDSNPRVYLKGVHIETGTVVQDPVYFFTLAEPNAVFSLTTCGGKVVAVYVVLEPAP